MKYFYEDPEKALRMAERYGIEFEARVEGKMLPVSSAYLALGMVKGLAITRFYIHPESLAVLKGLEREGADFDKPEIETAGNSASHHSIP